MAINQYYVSKAKEEFGTFNITFEGLSCHDSGLSSQFKMKMHNRPTQTAQSLLENMPIGP